MNNRIIKLSPCEALTRCDATVTVYMATISEMELLIVPWLTETCITVHPVCHPEKNNVAALISYM